ncbi:MAG: OmpA family protein [Gemmatimonadota bacterium]|nr:OmpA family protein [Gemmatimonadota bacterium]
MNDCPGTPPSDRIQKVGSHASLLRRAVPAALVLLGIATAPGQAQNPMSRWGLETWEINGFIGGLADAVEFSPDLDRDQLRRDALFGARVGYTFPSNLFVQLDGSNALVRIAYPDPGISGFQLRNTNAFFTGGTVGYNLQPRRNVQLFVAAGAGLAVWGAELSQRQVQPRFNYGVGARYFLTPQLAIRSDLRIHQVPSALEDLRTETLGTTVSGGTLYGAEASIGVSFFTHNSGDEDGDGINDEDDRCPGTRPGGLVDETGCEIDTDLDGVPDPLDQCPGTPRGARVGENGCSSDGDGDGVLDGLDQCPGTMPGADVDENGCASDGDEDGIPDGLDECPRTPSGSPVNAQGCSEAELRIEAGRLILHNVYFNFDQETMRSESQAALDEVGQILAERDDLRVEIQGHTDSIGDEDFNLRLSQARADAVLEYLTSRFPNTAGRLSAVGLGESQPLADNGFVEGRQENRRVEFIVRPR